MSDLQDAAQAVVDFAWDTAANRPSSVVATIPWDLLWKLKDALEQKEDE